MKVKSIDYHGGACPYQCEGQLEDGRFFYLRYRGGGLRLYVGDRMGQLPSEECLVFQDRFGCEDDGLADNEIFHQKLDGIIKFPPNFIFGY